MSKFALLILATCLVAFSQRPEGSGKGRGGERGREWWDNPVISDLKLSEAQRKQIQGITRDYRNRLVDARAAQEKAENDLQDAFNDASADEHRANELIERVAKSRGDFLRLVTQMSWKFRNVLTSEQWQELQRRGGGIPGAPGGDRGGRGGQTRRGPGGRPEEQGGKAPTSQQSSKAVTN